MVDNQAHVDALYSFTLMHSYFGVSVIPTYRGGHPDLPLWEESKYRDYLGIVSVKDGYLLVTPCKREFGELKEVGGPVVSVPMRNVEDIEMVKSGRPRAAQIAMFGVFAVGMGKRQMIVKVDDPKYGEVEVLLDYGETKRSDGIMDMDYARLKAAMAYWKARPSEDVHPGQMQLFPLDEEA